MEASCSHCFVLTLDFVHPLHGERPYICALGLRNISAVFYRSMSERVYIKRMKKEQYRK